MKIQHSTVEWSSEMAKYEAKNLDQPSPQNRGWMSKQFCIYPQMLGFDLGPARHIYRIQILFHHILIPERIDVLVGPTAPNRSDPAADPTAADPADDLALAQLGSVLTRPKSDLTSPARELKSVEVNCTAGYVRLLLHRNHLHKDNLCNQVGLIAISFFGRAPGDTTTNTNNTTSTIGGSSWQHSRRLKNPPPDDTLVDLAVSVYVDRDCVDLMEKLQRRKRSAAKHERFVYADNCQKATAVLHRAGQLLARYSCQRAAAVDREDYTGAKWHQQQEEHLRRQLLLVVPVQQLLEDKYKRKDNDKVMHLRMPKPLAASKTTDKSTEVEGLDTSRRRLPIAKHTSAGAQTDDKPAELNTSAAKTVVKADSIAASPADTGLTRARATSDLADLSSELPPAASLLPAVAGQPTVTQRREQPANARAAAAAAAGADTSSSNNNNSSSYHTLPRIRGRKSIAGVMIGDTGSSSSTQPTTAPLSDKEQMETNLAIEVFGREQVEQIFSKNFEVKEAALRKLLATLRTDDGSVSAEKRTRASAFLLRRTVKDKVFSTFSLTCEVLMFIIGPYATLHRTNRRVLSATMEKLFPDLLLRCGDNAQRTQTTAINALVKMADSAVSRDLSSVLSRLTEPVTDRSASQRVVEARLDISDQLTAGGRGQKCDQSLIEKVVDFVVSCLRHASESVRYAATQLLLKLYPSHHSLVRHRLPADRLFRTTLTYRQLAAKMDTIDSQRNKSEKQDNKPAVRKTSKAFQLPADPALAKETGGPDPEQEDLTADGDEEASASISPSLRGRSRSLSEINLRDGIEKGSVHTACVFCGALDSTFGDVHRMERHYGTSCPMLVQCHDCCQTVEISALTEHRLRECENRANYAVCTRCLEAIAVSRHADHTAQLTCSPGKAGPAGNRCPLCHTNCAPYDSGWRYHLLTECTGNTRRQIKPVVNDILDTATTTATSAIAPANNNNNKSSSSSNNKNNSKSRNRRPFLPQKPGAYSMDPVYVDRKRRVVRHRSPDPASDKTPESHQLPEDADSDDQRDDSDEQDESEPATSRLRMPRLSEETLGVLSSKSQLVNYDGVKRDGARRGGESDLARDRTAQNRYTSRLPQPTRKR